MLVAAAKINQSSIVPAFDQTRVPRIIQVPSGAANSKAQNLDSYYQNRILRWAGHVARMPIAYGSL